LNTSHSKEEIAMPKPKKKPAAEKFIQYDLFGHPVEDEPKPSEELFLLDWESHGVRMILINGQSHWVASDSCRLLEIGNTSLAVNGQERVNSKGERYWSGGLDDDEKGIHTVNTLGGPQELLLVTLPGLLKLIAKSEKPEAKRFQRWVFHEVLPEIMRTGTYSAHSRRASKWKRRLKCDDATAKKRVDQVDINKRTHSRIFAEKGGVSECASWHNAAYAGQFGDEVTAGKLRTDLEIPKWDTPLNHMGLVPLSVNHLGKAITEQAIADSKQELSPDEQVATLMRVTRAISKDTITQLGHEAGSDYVYGIVHKSKRGMLIDTVQKQLTAQ
jgi:prophage antirepressor-like protein